MTTFLKPNDSISKAENFVNNHECAPMMSEEGKRLAAKTAPQDAFAVASGRVKSSDVERTMNDYARKPI